MVYLIFEYEKSKVKDFIKLQKMTIRRHLTTAYRKYLKIILF